MEKALLDFGERRWTLHEREAASLAYVQGNGNEGRRTPHTSSVDLPNQEEEDGRVAPGAPLHY